MGNKIVVVDDEEKITRMLQILLEQHGYQVLVSHDGLAAYDMIVKEKPDLVLSDLLLPRLHGFELCKRIRETAGLDGTPVILMTAVYKTTKYKGEAVRYGANDFVIKPLEHGDLLARVGRFVQAKATQPAALATEAVAKQLKALRQEYASRLPERVSGIQAIWAGLTAGKWDPEVFKSLHRGVHGLTGSGATFGFGELSDAARGAEGVMSSVLDTPGKPAAEWIRQIDTAIRILGKAAARVVEDSDGFHPDLTLAPIDPSPRIEADTRKIYLVEGDPAQAQDLALQVGWFGYSVRTFPVAAGLKDAVSAETPSAIVIDVADPEGDPDVIAEILAIQETQQVPIPVMFLSSRSDLESRLWAVRAGGGAYLIKPADVRELIDKIDHLTARNVQEPGRVLIVEDEPELSEFYRQVLGGAGFETAVVNDPMKVLEPLSEFNPDMILMDIYMPTCTGLELARVVRQQENYVGIPIVFLSSESDLDRQVQAMGSGADGFLTKPITTEHLVSAVASRVERARTLRSFMVRDSLTGLLNHSKIEEQLDVQVARAQRQRTRLVFAMIDADNFKAVNDTHGHLVGDRVIKTIGRLLKQRLRKTDIIGRWGGDEFAVILPDTDGLTARRVLEEARQGFAQVRHQSPEGAFHVTLSCGIADYPAYCDANSLGVAADKALYVAKRAGGDEVALAPSSTRST